VSERSSIALHFWHFRKEGSSGVAISIYWNFMPIKHRFCSEERAIRRWSSTSGLLTIIISKQSNVTICLHSSVLFFRDWHKTQTNYVLKVGKDCTEDSMKSKLLTRENCKRTLGYRVVVVNRSRQQKFCFQCPLLMWCTRSKCRLSLQLSVKLLVHIWQA